MGEAVFNKFTSLTSSNMGHQAGSAEQAHDNITSEDNQRAIVVEADEVHDIQLNNKGMPIGPDDKDSASSNMDIDEDVASNAHSLTITDAQSTNFEDGENGNLEDDDDNTSMVVNVENYTSKERFIESLEVEDLLTSVLDGNSNSLSDAEDSSLLNSVNNNAVVDEVEENDTMEVEVAEDDFNLPEVADEGGEQWF